MRRRTLQATPPLPLLYSCAHWLTSAPCVPHLLSITSLQSKGHGKSVDWWALGILIYEMLAGFPPFFDENPFGIYQKILAGKIEFPRWVVVWGGCWECARRSCAGRVVCTNTQAGCGATGYACLVT